jgi:hypothetical protein
MIKLIISSLVIIVSTLITFSADAIEITIFDHICKEEELYKPYLKYYMGRSAGAKDGNPTKSFPPGFHADFMNPDLENVYICINGL